MRETAACWLCGGLDQAINDKLDWCQSKWVVCYSCSLLFQVLGWMQVPAGWRGSVYSILFTNPWISLKPCTRRRVKQWTVHGWIVLCEQVAQIGDNLEIGCIDPPYTIVIVRYLGLLTMFNQWSIFPFAEGAVIGSFHSKLLEALTLLIGNG